VLPWLTAWARLIVDDASALEVANQAVAHAASGRKALKAPELRLAARDEAAKLLAHGVAAVPAHESAAGHASTTARSHTSNAAVFAPPTPGGDVDDAGAGDAKSSRSDPREQTQTGRLAIALESLAPFERLACVTYFVDGSGTDAVASLLGVSRERAVEILENAAPALAHAVGENEIPDFAATVDEVEVVTR